MIATAVTAWGKVSSSIVRLETKITDFKNDLKNLHEEIGQLKESISSNYKEIQEKGLELSKDLERLEQNNKNLKSRLHYIENLVTKKFDTYDRDINDFWKRYESKLRPGMQKDMFRDE